MSKNPLSYLKNKFNQKQARKKEVNLSVLQDEKTIPIVKEIFEMMIKTDMIMGMKATNRQTVDACYDPLCKQILALYVEKALTGPEINHINRLMLEPINYIQEVLKQSLVKHRADAYAVVLGKDEDQLTTQDIDKLLKIGKMNEAIVAGKMTPEEAEKLANQNVVPKAKLGDEVKTKLWACSNCGTKSEGVIAPAECDDCQVEGVTFEEVDLNNDQSSKLEDKETQKEPILTGVISDESKLTDEAKEAGIKVGMEILHEKDSGKIVKIKCKACADKGTYCNNDCKCECHAKSRMKNVSQISKTETKE